jgi:adenylate cyclase
LLAIFLIATGAQNVHEVCLSALAAAQAARAAIAAANPIEGDIGFGLALHVGEVLYGNIGSGNRLDCGTAATFTRLSRLAKRLWGGCVAGATEGGPTAVDR